MHLNVEGLIPVHAVYNSGNWGRTIGYQASHCFSHDSLMIVTSFGKLDSLVLSNIADRSQRVVFAGSSHFTMEEEIPLTDKPSQKEKDFEKGVRYDFTHPAYHSIQYDPVAERYYRLTQYDFPSEDMIAKNRGEIRLGISYSIIVLNKKFEKLGEVTLPAVTDLNMNYVFARDGFIYIAPLPRYQPYEDSLIFNKYQISS